MNNATRTMTSTIGVICGLSGLEHGFFEILQGNIAPEIHSISGRPMIYAIGDVNRFWPYGFEYAYTIMPNYLITGILAMIFSLLVIVWSARYIQKKAGWFILILLSVFQYLVGGGAAQLGPAVIVGLVAVLINHPLKLRKEFVCLVLGRPWAWLLAAFSIVFCHSIVTAVFGFFYGLKDPEVINQILYGMLYIMIGLLPLVILSALAHDSWGVSAINPEAER